jgi:dihydroorotate dehydrogenase
MKLKNVEFSNTIGQSGVQGFFDTGDEYQYQKLYKNLFSGYSFDWMGFTAKTVTLKPRIGNTALNGFRFRKFLPNSIWVSLRSFIEGYMLNAVGLSNTGLDAILATGYWQGRKDAFMISIQLEGNTLEDKLKEVRTICSKLKTNLVTNQYGIQLNLSCPNTEHKDSELDEIKSVSAEFEMCLPSVPLILKFNALVEHSVISDLKGCCDAFCVSNTIPFGERPDLIDWDYLFPFGSPLEKRKLNIPGKGGLSGAPIFPVVCDWLDQMDRIDSSVKIIAGGGIMSEQDVVTITKFTCVKALCLGTVATLRPWKVRDVIKKSNEILLRK